MPKEAVDPRGALPAPTFEGMIRVEVLKVIFNKDNNNRVGPVIDPIDAKQFRFCSSAIASNGKIQNLGLTVLKQTLQLDIDGHVVAQ
ncbi:MAG: hypothetical protein RIK87_07465 [Fuerstiella sp.]